MKSATVTWITYNNYGTALQAYALQQYLIKRGLDNVIISDKEIIAAKKTSQKEMPEETSSKRWQDWVRYYGCHPWRIVFSIYYTLQHKKCEHIEKPYHDSQKLFDDFKVNDLRILDGLRREDMPNLNASVDMFFCGSDQIWSVLEHNFDGYYFLNFAKGKKVAYAASIGTVDIPADKHRAIVEYLKDFSAIAVREQQSAKQLSQWIDKKVDWVVDPTLLHESDFWRDFSAGIKTPNRKYLLCYFLGKQEWYFTYAKELADHFGLKIVLIPSCTEFMKFKEAYEGAVGPKEFVALIRDADFVLTDSYHGSIFALQFEKNFLHIKRFLDNDKNCQNIRVYSLFSALQLEKLIVSKKKFSKQDIQPINYSDIKSLISDYRASSREYIDKSLTE